MNEHIINVEGTPLYSKDGTAYKYSFKDYTLYRHRHACNHAWYELIRENISITQALIEININDKLEKINAHLKGEQYND